MQVQTLKNWPHKQTPVATSWARQRHKGRLTLPTAQTRWTCNCQSHSPRTLMVQEKFGLLPRNIHRLPISQSFDVSITTAMITSLAYLFITLAAHPRQPTISLNSTP